MFSFFFSIKNFFLRHIVAYSNLFSVAYMFFPLQKYLIFFVRNFWIFLFCLGTLWIINWFHSLRFSLFLYFFTDCFFLYFNCIYLIFNCFLLFILYNRNLLQLKQLLIFEKKYSLFWLNVFLLSLCLILLMSVCIFLLIVCDSFFSIIQIYFTF